MNEQQGTVATPTADSLNEIDQILKEDQAVIASVPRFKHILRPRGLWIVIRPIKKTDTVSSGGIVLPSSSAGVQQGTIEALDESVVKDLKVGMTVVFTNFPTDLDRIEDLTGDRDLLLVRSEEVYAEAIRTEELLESRSVTAIGE